MLQPGIGGKELRNQHIDCVHRFCVYLHTVPDGRQYVGITESKNPNERWANGKGYKDNPEFWECIQAVGWNNVKHEILEMGLSMRQVRRREAELIKELNTISPNGFNRRLDYQKSHIKHKAEMGDRYGICTVLNYWPDENRRKIYWLECDCGNRFVCHGWNIRNDQDCGCVSGVQMEITDEEYYWR